MAKGQPIRAGRKVTLKPGSAMGPPIPTPRSQQQDVDTGPEQRQPMSVRTVRTAPPQQPTSVQTPRVQPTQQPQRQGGRANPYTQQQMEHWGYTADDWNPETGRFERFGRGGGGVALDPAKSGELERWNRLQKQLYGHLDRGPNQQVQAVRQPVGQPPPAQTRQPTTVGPTVTTAPQMQPQGGAGGRRQLPTNQELFGGDLGGDAVQRAVYERGLQQLQPQMDAAKRRMSQSLVDRGIPLGSEKYNLEMNRFENAQQQALADLSMRAVQAGAMEQSRRIGILQSLRGQEFGEFDADRRFGAGRTDADRAYGLARDRFGLDQQRFGEQQRQFDARLGFDQQRFGEDRRRYDQQFAEDLRRYQYGTEEDRRRYDQQWASSEEARMFQQDMARRGMDLQELSTQAQIDLARRKANLDALLAANVISQQQHDQMMQQEYLEIRQRESDLNQLLVLGGGAGG